MLVSEIVLFTATPALDEAHSGARCGSACSRAADAISRTAVRATRCLRPLVRLPKRASIADARSTAIGAVRSHPGPLGTEVRHEIPPRSGVAFELARGQRLRVIDPEDEQVADLPAHNRQDIGEALSSGHSLDYASCVYLTTRHAPYPNRSTVLLRIVEDMVGRHDFLPTPCSAEIFRIFYGDEQPHRGCFGNPAAALSPYGVVPDAIPAAFNIFMNVPMIDAATGKLRVDRPLIKAGDSIVFEACFDLVIGLTACSAGQSNNFRSKPIHCEILDAG